MTDELYELPDGWTWKELRNVVEINYGDGLRAQDRKGGEVLVFGSNGEIGRHNSALTSGKTIIIGRKGSVGEVHFSESACWPIDTTYFVDQFPNDTDARFLFQFLRSQDLPHLDRSTAVPGINRNDLYAVDVPLPPLPEQRRIVARIESLFAESRTARDALERVPALLKRFRQSVLASAFRGELTERDPNDEPASALLERVGATLRGRPVRGHAEQGQPHRVAPTDTAADLPDGWAWATIRNAIGNEGVFIDGDWIESKDQDPHGDVRLVQLADVGDGFYRNKSNRYLTSSKAKELGCTFLKPNDVLIARMPDPLGRACIFPGDTKPCVTAVDVCIVRPGKNAADPRWLMFAINVPAFRQKIESLQSGTTRKRISRGNLATLKLPHPPLAEQRRIVAKIEALFAQADAIEHAVAIAQKRADKIGQSILARAFRGGL